MKRVVVTGGSGKAGRAVVRDLLENGYDVLNVDIAPAAEAAARPKMHPHPLPPALRLPSSEQHKRTS